MSVAQCREINRRLRAAGVTVHEWPGAESRGNGLTSSYVGGLVHHTASGYGAALPGTGIGALLVGGRPDLPGPLCNWAGNHDGSVVFVAAHPANHAGASGGKSMGPLPRTTLFNKWVVGLEIVYPGSSPMTAAQYRSAVVWARIVADVVGGGNIETVRAHAETSVTGKWDPGEAPGRTIDMTVFRRDATRVRTLPTPPPSPDLEDDDMVRFVKGDSDIPIPGTNNVFGDVVFKIEYAHGGGAIAVRTRVTSPQDPGYRAFLEMGGTVHQIPQGILDKIPDKIPPLTVAERTTP